MSSFVNMVPPISIVNKLSTLGSNGVLNGKHGLLSTCTHRRFLQMFCLASKPAQSVQPTWNILGVKLFLDLVNVVVFSLLSFL